MFKDFNFKPFLIVFIIMILFIGGVYIFYRLTEFKLEEKENIKFDKLQETFESKGYTCQSMNQPGNYCSKEKDNISYKFIRYSDGFQYIVTNDSYKISLKYRQSGYQFYIYMGKDAQTSLQDKQYFCTTTNDTYMGDIKECLTEDDELLESDMYISIMKNTLNEISNVVNMSGYDNKKLATLFTWTY